MKYEIKKGSASVAIYVFIQDSSSTTGAGLTGLAYNTASLTAYYVRPLGNATAITLATQTVTGAYSSGGFVEIDATNMPGWYRLDIPNAAIDTGVNSVAVQLKGAANMAPCNLEIQLVAYDPQSAIPTANENADALLDRANGIETSLTLRGAMRLIAAACAGKLSGAATTTATIRNVGDTKARITATVDADGNRTAVTTDAT